jgi:AcrR family transcriptional regulator
MASRDEKKAATRKKLLDAAASIVAKQGAMAASLDAIAEKAGLTKGAVYSNFANKEELIEELASVAGLAVDATELFEDDTQSLVDLLDAYGREIESMFRTASAKTWRLTYEILNFAQHNARIRRDIASGWRESREMGADFLERVAANNGTELPLSGVEMSLVIEALALGVAQLRTIDPKSIPDGFVSRVLRLVAT